MSYITVIHPSIHSLMLIQFRAVCGLGPISAAIGQEVDTPRTGHQPVSGLTVIEQYNSNKIRFDKINKIEYMTKIMKKENSVFC